MTTVYKFRKSDQFKRYIGQFMRVFSGFQVQDGVARDGEFLTKRVPIVYGNMSRIVASTLSKRDFLANPKLPFMAANVASIEPDVTNKRSPHYISEVAMRNAQNDVPTDVVERMSGPAFLMNMELSLYASSTTELFELLEQILLVFNPRVAIQATNDLYDWNYITDVSLASIQPEIQYPMGTEQSIVQLTMMFTVPVRLRYPSGVDNNIIQQIIANVKEDDTLLMRTTLTGNLETGEIVIQGEDLNG